MTPAEAEALAEDCDRRAVDAPTQDLREFWQRKAAEYWNQVD